MTVKRFTLLDETIIDNEKVADDGGKEIYWIVEYAQRVKLVKLLNVLHEETQSSKEFIEQLQEELVLFKEAGANMGIDLNTQITALKNENEQLKFQLQNTSDQRDEFHRGARENANRVGKLKKENEQLKGEVAHYKLILMSLEEQAKRLSEIHCVGDKE